MLILHFEDNRLNFRHLWAQTKRKGGLALEREGFSRKKISNGMGSEARDFSEKIFSEISKFCATLVAPRAAWF